MVTNKIKPDDFVRSLDFYEEEGILRTLWLKRDEFRKSRLSIDVGSNLRNSSQLAQLTETEGKRIVS